MRPASTDQPSRFTPRTGDVGTYEYDIRTGHVAWSDAMCRICGVDAGAIAVDAELHLQLCHADDRDALRAGTSEAVQRGSSEFEYRTVRPGGEVRHLFVRAIVLPDDEGDPSQLIGIVLDLTARREIDAQLRRTEARYKALADATSQVTWVSPPEGGPSDISDSWVTVTGHPKSAALGTRFLEVIPKEDVDNGLPRWEQEIAAGRAYEAEFRLRRADGRLLHVRSRSLPVFDDSGHVCERIGALTDLTATRDAEAARRASEEMFYQAFNASPIAMSIIALQPECGETLQVNEAFVELTGRPRAGLAGSRIDDDTMWLDGPTPATLLCESGANVGRAGPVQARLRRADDEVRVVQIRTEPIEVDGRACALTSFEDLTPRVEMERRLAESEERLRWLSEAAWEGVALWDDGVLLDANPQLANILGYERDELVGKRIVTFIASDSMTVVADRVLQRSTEPYEHNAVRKDGSIIRVEVRARSVPYKGRLIRMVAVRDVSARRRLDDSRRALVAATAGVSGAEFFRSLVKHLSAALGLKYAIAAELLPPGDRARTLCLWDGEDFGAGIEYPIAGTPTADVIAHGMRFYHDGLADTFSNDQVLRRNGIVSYIGIPIVDVSGIPVGVLAVMDDQPFERTDYLESHLKIFAMRAGLELDRIRAEERTRRLNAELERRVADRTAELRATNHELEAFSYSVSHDLRAPVRHIAGFVDLLNREARGTLSASARELVDEIADSAGRMGKLIDDLLEFSRVERAELRKGPVDLRSLVDEVIAEVERDLNGRHVEWRIADIPAVRGDRDLLRQVLTNLLGNGLKYSRSRPVATIEVGALAADSPSDVVCFVRDNGVGFDMRYAHRLFGVFQRLHPASAFEGTGIGLANVQRIVHRHGGRVWATAEIDRGATFYFALPGSGDDADAGKARKES